MFTAILLALVVAGTILGQVFGATALLTGIIVLSILLLSALLTGKNIRNIAMSEHLKRLTAYAAVCVIGIGDASFRSVPEFEVTQDKDYRIEAEVIKRRTLSTCEMYQLEVRSIDGKKSRGRLAVFAGADEIFMPGDLVGLNGRIADGKVKNDYLNKLHLIRPAGKIRQFFNSLSLKFAIGIEKTSLSSDSKAILMALLLGDRSLIHIDKIELFRNSGVIHILALSGMHIGIITGLILWITLPLNLIAGRRYRCPVVILTVWFFVFLTGGAFSTIRAGIMITITMLAIMLDRQRDAFSVCCFTAIIMILIWPDVIMDIGFQLSLASVMMLTLLAQPLNPISHRHNPLLYRIFEVVIVAIIATAATWMLTAYHFGSAPASFLPANVIILPLLPIYLIGGIIYIVIFSLGIEIEFLRYILDSVPKLTYSLLEHVATSQLLIEVSLSALLLWIGGLVAVAIAVRNYRIIYVDSRTMNGIDPKIDIKWIIAGSVLFLASMLMIGLRI